MHGAYDSHGTRRLIRDAANGAVVPMNDPKDANGTLRPINDPPGLFTRRQIAGYEGR